MRAVLWDGPGRVRVDEAPEPKVEEPGDAIVSVTRTAICASDLHLVHGKTPGAHEGTVIGHEFTGTVAEVGDDVSRFTPGRRVLGSFLIACGGCASCVEGRFNFCSERRALGLGSLTGDLAGAQAESVRVPNADLNLHGLGDDLDDERALFAGDILATGFYAVARAGVGGQDAVAVIGAGPVGLFCALAAGLYTDGPVLVLDTDPGRVAFARGLGLDAHDVSETDPAALVNGLTEGRLADASIEAVGAGPAFKSAMKCVREGGRVAIVGVYGQERYELPMGMVWARGIELRFAGMANVQAHWDDVLEAVGSGVLDPTAVITHRMSLEDAVEGYELFSSRAAMKVVLTP